MDYICSFSEVQCTFLLNMTMFMYYFAVILLADHLPFPMPSTDKSGSKFSEITGSFQPCPFHTEKI